MSMKCAWCGRVLDHNNRHIPSHGICGECKKTFLMQSHQQGNGGDENSAAGKQGKDEKRMNFLI